MLYVHVWALLMIKFHCTTHPRVYVIIVSLYRHIPVLQSLYRYIPGGQENALDTSLMVAATTAQFYMYSVVHVSLMYITILTDRRELIILLLLLFYNYFYFSYVPSVITVWNTLPVDIRSSSSVSVFKHNLLHWAHVLY